MSPSNHPNPCACVCTKCHNGQAIEELKARCLAAEAAVKHHEHYVKTSVSIVADCEGELSKLRVAARQLVAALPKCNICRGAATRPPAHSLNNIWCCDKHRGSLEAIDDVNYAAPLRALAALLPDEESLKAGGGAE